MTKSKPGWFRRQPVIIKAAVIGAFGAVAAAVISAMLTSVFTSNERARLVPHQVPNRLLKNINNVAVVAFTVDSRVKDIGISLSNKTEYKYIIRSRTFPVIIVAFYNSTNIPQVLTGVQVLSKTTSCNIKTAKILTPYIAYKVYLEEGFQTFVPPLSLEPGEVAAIHIQLAPPRKIRDSFACGGMHQLRFQIGGHTVLAPKFLWRRWR